MLMLIKNILRRFGFDIVRYHSIWDSTIKKRGIRTILDIGAHGGESALEMRERFPNAMILSFEPLKEFYDRLEKGMAGDKNFRGYNIALGDKNADAVIHKSAAAPSSSLLPMAALHKKLYPGSEEYIDEHIRIERLDDALQSANLEEPLLIKIDVQGFEAGVIRGGIETLKKASVVVVENSFTTLYEGQALFGEVHNLLAQLGFTYRGRAQTHYNQESGEPIYEDSVFVKE